MSNQNQSRFIPPGVSLVQPSRAGTVATVLAIGMAIVAAIKMGGEAFGTQTWRSR